MLHEAQDAALQSCGGGYLEEFCKLAVSCLSLGCQDGRALLTLVLFGGKWLGELLEDEAVYRGRSPGECRG